MNKKYELTDECINIYGRKLYRIKALVDFSYVKSGDLGGYVESYDNLSQEGTCWIYGSARVFGSAIVYGNAIVGGNARVGGNAIVDGNSIVSGNAIVGGNAIVDGNAKVFGSAEVSSNIDFAVVSGFGTAQRSTTFFRLANGNIGVKCGCFYGTIDEFIIQVKKTRTGKIADEYLAIADLMKYHFNKEEYPEE